MTLSRLYADEGILSSAIKDRKKARKERERRRNLVAPKELWEIYASDIDDSMRIRDGEYSIELIMHYLGLVFRSEDQKAFHKVFISTALRLMFGDDFNRFKHVLRKKYKFDRLTQQCMVCCPRRTGKTFASAQFAAVALLCIFVDDMMVKDRKRGCKVSIFSPSKRQSQALISHIVAILERINQTDRIIMRSKERLEVLNFNNQVAIVMAYPAVISTVRGTDGDIILCDEIAFIKEEFIKEVVLPLFSIDKSCLIGVSTVLDDDNHMSKFMDLKDNNEEDLFHTLRVFAACDKCIAAEKAASCTHKTKLAPWQSIRKHLTLKNMYKEDEKTFLQEIGGIGFNLNEACFKTKFIQSLFAREPVDLHLRSPYNYVFISVDPTSCGLKSDVAILSTVKHGGSMIIVGAENKNVNDTKEASALLVHHVAELNKNPRLRNALKVFIVENNLTAACEMMTDAIKDHLYNYVIIDKMNENSTNKRATFAIGVQTTHSVKAIAVEETNNMLKLGSLLIGVEKLFVSLSLSYTEFQKVLKTQLGDFSKVIIEKEMKKDEVHYNGKCKGSKKDDLMMALLLNTFWSRYFFNNPKYEKYIVAPQ